MLNEMIDNISNIPELETLGVKDTAHRGHAMVKVPVKFFSALWYYADMAEANRKNKGWSRFLEIMEQFYNQEDIKGSKAAIRSLEKTIRTDKDLKSAIQTLKYIIDNTTNFDAEYEYPLEDDNE